MSTYTFESNTLIPRCERRRRQTKYLRVPATYGPELNSNHPFDGMLIARTAKGYLPALRRRANSRYEPHVGKKQLAKAATRNHVSA